MAELEVKLCVPEAAVPSLRAALRAHRARTTRMQATYFDTADGALARAGVALRLRLEGRRWMQTLKAAGAGAVHRQEHEVRVPGPASPMPALDIARHDGSEAASALHAALHDAPAPALIERHGTDVARLRCALRDARGTEIEVALDTGQVRAGALSAPLCELELEHKAGPVQGVFDLAGAWIEHGGLWLCTTTKAARGERLSSASAAPPPTRARGTGLAADADGPTLLRALLQSALEHVLANVSDLAEGVNALETIHQARVGLRRLRTVLRELAALSPAIAPQWDGALSAAFARLGELRDDEVCALAVRPLLQAVSAPLLAWRPRGQADPMATARDPAFQRTLVAILALAHAGDERFAALSPAATRDWLAQRLGGLHRQVTRDGRRFHRLPLERQHRVRKRLKRLRYLAELTLDLWPEDAARRYLKRLGAAQDALGHHNDVAVAAAAFRAEAAERPAAWFAAGYLEAHLAVTARVARKVLVKVAQADEFWT
ncbi:MAG TPA: CYTH and CHAD domain-containing protein [Burkholderiaceae bacterium]|nr:CYTH and CHAD domain-containing protein [Burkholderiaceae bacterium]